MEFITKPPDSARKGRLPLFARAVECSWHLREAACRSSNVLMAEGPQLEHVNTDGKPNNSFAGISMNLPRPAFGPAGADHHYWTCNCCVPVPGDSSQRTLVQPAHMRATVRMCVPVTEVHSLPGRHLENFVESATLPVMVRAESLAFVLSVRPWSDKVLDDGVTITSNVSREHSAGFERICSPSLTKHLVERNRIDPQSRHACPLQSGQSCLAAKT